MAGELDLGAFGTEGQIGTPEQTVIAEGHALMAEVRAVDGDAPPAQPAQQANHQHQKSLFAQACDVVVLRVSLGAGNDRTLPHRQRAAKVAQEQGEVAQALTHGFVQVGLLNQCAADQGEAARGHAVRVEPEELIVSSRIWISHNAANALAGTRATGCSINAGSIPACSSAALRRCGVSPSP